MKIACESKQVEVLLLSQFFQAQTNKMNMYLKLEFGQKISGSRALWYVLQL